MKLFLFLVMSGVVFTSCGEKKGGKKRKMNFPPQRIQEQVQFSNGMRVASLKSTKIEFISEGVGVLEKAKILQTSRRFLRNKILRQSFLNLAGVKNKDQLEIETRDEFRFFPGEISSKTKLNGQKLLSDSDELGSWKLSGTLNLTGINKNEEIKNLIIGLRTESLIDGNLSHVGTDLLRGKNGQPLNFSKKESKKEFDLAFSDIPMPLLETLISFNSALILEVEDFQVNLETMNDYLQRSREDKIRLIISTPEKEHLFFLKPGQLLKDFLLKLDPKMKLDYRGLPSTLLALEQDDMYTRPDRNILNNIDHYGDEKIWWANIKGSLENYKMGHKTIVLSFSSYGELRETREQWDFFELPLKSELSINQFKATQIVGEITKESSEYKTVDSIREIPFEIGTKECVEDDRFERKRSDCYINWRPAFSYPIAILRTQKSVPKRLRELREDEFLLESYGKSRLLEDGSFFELRGPELKSQLVLSKGETLKNVKGGFVGWKFYDSRLGNYKTRAPHDNLSTTTLKSGFKNTYSVLGWKKKFVPAN